jgi:hypothetical protein
MDYEDGDEQMNKIKYVLFMADFPDTADGMYWKDHYTHQYHTMMDARGYARAAKRWRQEEQTCAAI